MSLTEISINHKSLCYASLEIWYACTVGLAFLPLSPGPFCMRKGGLGTRLSSNRCCSWDSIVSPVAVGIWQRPYAMMPIVADFESSLSPIQMYNICGERNCISELNRLHNRRTKDFARSHQTAFPSERVCMRLHLGMLSIACARRLKHHTHYFQIEHIGRPRGS